MKRDKRAVSTLIATVLIIGITIAAFGIVYAYIIPIVRSGIESSKKCSDMQLSVDTTRGYTYYDDSSNNDVHVMVSRGPKSGELVALQLKVTDNTGNSVTIKNTDLITNPGVPNSNEDVSYNVSGQRTDISGAVGDHGLTGTPQTVSVAAVILIGNQESACDLTPEVSLSAKSS